MDLKWKNTSELALFYNYNFKENLKATLRKQNGITIDF